MTPEQQRILDAAETLIRSHNLTYGGARGDDTPIPTCAGCDASSWSEIIHYRDCAIAELIAAVRAIQPRA